MTQLEIKREAVRKPFGRRRKSCPLRAERAAHRLQGHQAAVPLHIRARQDRPIADLGIGKKQRELAVAIKRARFLALMLT